MDLDQEYSSEYRDWIIELKSKIQSTQLKAAILVNKELLSLYWEIGKSISTKIIQSKWGASVVEQLSKDLKPEFPNQKGFSRSNLFSMKQWFEFYFTSDIELEKIQQLVGQIPWGHNLAIITKSDTIEEALFYCNKTIENNWSRSILINQISSGFYNRKGQAITKFNSTLTEITKNIKTIRDKYIQILKKIDCKEAIIWTDAHYQTEHYIQEIPEIYSPLTMKDLIKSLQETDKLTLYNFADSVNRKVEIKNKENSFLNIALQDNFCDNIEITHP